MDFFDSVYQNIINLDLFGICDNGNGTIAYISNSLPSNWIATVKNPSREALWFYPIDFRLIFLRPNGDPDNICDCMLVKSDKKLLFVELKNSIQDYTERDTLGSINKISWMEKGIIQLTQTIHHFKIHHSNEFNSYKEKHAYISNKARPNYSINATIQDKFKKSTGFRLHINTQIQID